MTVDDKKMPGTSRRARANAPQGDDLAVLLQARRSIVAVTGYARARAYWRLHDEALTTTLRDRCTHVCDAIVDLESAVSRTLTPAATEDPLLVNRSPATMSDDNPSAEQPPPPPHAVPTPEEPPQDYRWLQTEFIKESPRLPAPTPPDAHAPHPASSTYDLDDLLDHLATGSLPPGLLEQALRLANTLPPDLAGRRRMQLIAASQR